MTNLLDYANYYATTMGWAVFPVPPGEKKSRKSAEHSNGRKWGATKEVAEIRDDFARWPDSNIGIPTGAENRIFVIDVDTPAGHDRDGFASLAALEAQHGALPPTLTAESPSGSRHYYFNHPGYPVKNSASEIGAGIDVRGDGGMVIAPPSVKGKGQYKWSDAVLIADAPDWLLDRIKKPEGVRATGPAPDAIDGLSHDGIRFNELIWWIEQMLKRWESGAEHLANDDWIKLGKRIKLSFPGADGLQAFMSMSWEDKHDAIARRWWDPADFKTEGENLATLPGLFARDSTWMFRHALGCPNSAPAAVAVEIPAEVLEAYERQRNQHAAALMGPLPDHPELPIHEANALSKFWAHLPSGKIIYEGTRELWSPGSLDKHIGRVKDAMKAEGPGMLATTWLSQHRAVQSMGWSPGEPMIIEGKVLTSDGWLHSPGDKTFNRYVPPDIKHVEGDVSKWLNHVAWVYPDEAEHIVLWLAHRVQHPGVKINHCLDFLGKQGIGKDTIVAPVIAAIGGQNFKQVAAKAFFKTEWNDFLQSVILRINEIHDLGGESRYGFYDATKDVTTSPPETHRINTKGVPQYAAVNVCGVIMTSNHPDALYIPADDRRHYVCSSNRDRGELPPGYFDDMHAWFENGGSASVAHYLANLDLSGFRAKAPPPKTAGWHMLVAAGLAPENGDLTDVIEAMGKPAAVTLQMVRSRTPFDSQLRLSFDDAKLRKALPKRLAECGYVAVSNPEARESGGRWRVAGVKATIYARQELSETERLAAARSLSTSAPTLIQSPLPPLPI